MNASYSPHRRRIALAGLTVLLLAVAALSLRIGVISAEVGAIVAQLPAAVLALVSARAPETPLAMILAEIRIPRLLLGAFVGAGLAICGACMQGLFRNPLADPGLLGASSSAALGAVAMIVFGGAWLSSWFLPGAAFIGALCGMLIVHRLSVVGGKTDVATMLLAGVAVNSIGGAAIGFLSYIADDAQLRNLIFWSLGSLEITARTKLLVGLAVIAPALLMLPRHADALNANLLGEREAGHLGVEMEKVKRRLIVWVALVVGAAVSLSGIIGFVGLIVPHLVRIVTGPDHRLLLPASALLGAALLVGADIVARSIAAPAEIPIGVITALLGGPFFLWLLVRFQRARAAAS